MSLYNDFMSSTAGLVWRAASGTVDPWTKDEIIEQAAMDRVQASQGSVTIEQARQQAAQDVTNVLTSFSLPGETSGRGADPSQVIAGLKSSLDIVGDIGETTGKTLLYAGIGVALLYGVFLLAQSGFLRKA